MNKALNLWLVWALLAAWAVISGSQHGWTALHKFILLTVVVLAVLQLALPLLWRWMVRWLNNLAPDARKKFLARLDPKTQAFAQAQLQPRPTVDAWGLDQLEQHGDDLSLPHTFEFQLRFATQSAAEQAASRLAPKEFVATVKPEPQGGEWLCVATRIMVPDETALQAIHADLDSIAVALGGHYDGWSMAAEKQN